MTRLTKRFVVMAAAFMYALLNISCIHACAEERQNLTKKLLVVIDNSGSMRSLDTVIQETLQIISAFDELAQDELTVDYLLFNADKIEVVSAEEIRFVQEAMKYQGETSVYKGLEKVEEWVNANKEQVPISILVLSDLFSSRDKNGDIFNWKAAKEEQNKINLWTAEWSSLIKADMLSALFIYWDSMAPGESVDMTLNALKENQNVSAGYQVKLYGLGNSDLLVDEMYSDGNINVNAEQEIAEKTACHILKIILGTEKVLWRPAGTIRQPNMSIPIKVPKSSKALIRIDKDGGKSETKILDVRNENEYPAKTFLEGEGIELYYIEETEKGIINVQTDQEGSTVYYILLP